MRKILMLVAGFSALAATSAPAAVVEFADPDWVHHQTEEVSWRARFDDSHSLGIQVDLSIDPGSIQADMLGFGFDSALTGLQLNDFQFLGSNTGEGITGLFSGRVCGTGCSFSSVLQPSEGFDDILRLGDNGSGNGRITSFSFLILTSADLFTADFSRVGFRAQSVDGGGAATDINSTATIVGAVPLPAGGVLLIGALAGLSLMRRRKSGM